MEAVVTRNVGGTLILLGPGANRLLRLHLFELMNKLALYERVRMQNWIFTVRTGAMFLLHAPEYNPSNNNFIYIKMCFL